MLIDSKEAKIRRFMVWLERQGCDCDSCSTRTSDLYGQAIATVWDFVHRHFGGFQSLQMGELWTRTPATGDEAVLRAWSIEAGYSPQQTAHFITACRHFAQYVAWRASLPRQALLRGRRYLLHPDT